MPLSPDKISWVLTHEFELDRHKNKECVEAVMLKDVAAAVKELRNKIISFIDACDKLEKVYSDPREKSEVRSQKDAYFTALKEVDAVFGAEDKK